KRGAGEVKGRTALRRARIVLAFGVLLAAGLLASGAFGRVSIIGSTSDSPPTATETTATETTATDSTSTDTTTTDAATSTTTTTTTTTTTPVVFSPTISSDQADYSPGATVTLTGAGWAPLDAVHIYVNDDEGQTWSYNADVTADAAGALTVQFQLPTSFVATYSVTATGLVS